jgi:hypothetical protein
VDPEGGAVAKDALAIGRVALHERALLGSERLGLRLAQVLAEEEDCDRDQQGDEDSRH